MDFPTTMTTAHLLINTLVPGLQSATGVITILRALLEDNATKYKLVPYLFHGLQSLPGAHFFKAAAVIYSSSWADLCWCNPRKKVTPKSEGKSWSGVRRMHLPTHASRYQVAPMSKLSEVKSTGEVKQAWVKTEGRWRHDSLFETGRGSCNLQAGWRQKLSAFKLSSHSMYCDSSLHSASVLASQAAFTEC